MSTSDGVDLDPPGRILRKPVADQVDAPQHLHGFGGLHGGFALALLGSVMRTHASGLELRSISATFGRPIRSGFHVTSGLARSGRTTRTVTAAAESDAAKHIEASAVFGAAGVPPSPVVTASAPAAPAPEECEPLVIPREFLPISTSMEIRPVGPGRPYAGGDEPELTAWVRLTEDDDPPDVLRFVFLMDALAPSYTAILSTLVLVPTVELTVRPAAGLSGAHSPWVLVRARTVSADSGGWVDETMDAWDPDGTHLGSGHQLRVVRQG
ncbi:thioesterase family protein [Streptomyces sp. NPDC048254]|uniref:thioesterase family protein n=1 Tax=Streptomyces sp. NPDC048254 TaxID=3365525 RepID=UPI0037248511